MKLIEVNCVLLLSKDFRAGEVQFFDGMIWNYLITKTKIKSSFLTWSNINCQILRL